MNEEIPTKKAPLDRNSHTGNISLSINSFQKAQRELNRIKESSTVLVTVRGRTFMVSTEELGPIFKITDADKTTYLCRYRY